MNTEMIRHAQQQEIQCNLFIMSFDSSLMQHETIENPPQNYIACIIISVMMSVRLFKGLTLVLA